MTQDSKQCARCGRTYPTAMFRKRKPRSSKSSGLSSRCRFCDREAQKSQPSRSTRARRTIQPPTEKELNQTKTCSRCHLDLPLFLFNRKSRYKDGHDIYCRHCIHEIYLLHKPIPNL